VDRRREDLRENLKLASPSPVSILPQKFPISSSNAHAATPSPFAGALLACPHAAFPGKIYQLPSGNASRKTSYRLDGSGWYSPDGAPAAAVFRSSARRWPLLAVPCRHDRRRHPSSVSPSSSLTPSSFIAARGAHAHLYFSSGHGKRGWSRGASSSVDTHLALEGLTTLATKNTRSNPFRVPFSELSSHLGQGDLSKIDMRKDLVLFLIRLNSVGWNLMLIFNIILI
jgi:hypothetical protein